MVGRRLLIVVVVVVVVAIQVVVVVVVATCTVVVFTIGVLLPVLVGVRVACGRREGGARACRAA